MIHELRIAAEKTVIHAIKYVLRLLKMGLFNVAYLFVRQQYFQLIFCALVTLAWNIQTGVIESAASLKNAQALGYIGATFCVVIVVFSFVAAPFNLDREREAKIAGQEGELKRLRIKIQRPQNTSQLPITTTKATISPSKPIPTVTLSCTNISKEPFIFTGTAPNVVGKLASHYNHSEREMPVGEAFFITLEPKLVNCDRISVKVKSIPTFHDVDRDVKIQVRKGIWLDENNEFVFIETGDFIDLVITFEIDGKWFGYEHHSVTETLVVHEHEYLLPKLVDLPGKNYRIEIRFLGKYYSEDVFEQTMHFELALGTEPATLKEIQRNAA